MTVYVLNAISAAMFSPPVRIHIIPITVEKAAEIVRYSDFVSAIGHQATAELLSRLLGREIPTNRVDVKLTAGDSAILFSLKRRLGEGQIIKSVQELEEIGYNLWWVGVE